MTKINPNFGYWKKDTYHLKLTINNGLISYDGSNPYVNIMFSGNSLRIYALQDISIAFSQNCFSQNYTPNILNIELNPTYISLNDMSYSNTGDACDLTLWRCLEQNYGLELSDLPSQSYNLEILIR